MQTGLVEYALVKIVPRAARASRLGVWTVGCSAYPAIFGLCSSDMMTRKFSALISVILKIDHALAGQSIALHLRAHSRPCLRVSASPPPVSGARQALGDVRDP